MKVSVVEPAWIECVLVDVVEVDRLVEGEEMGPRLTELDKVGELELVVDPTCAATPVDVVCSCPSSVDDEDWLVAVRVVFANPFCLGRPPLRANADPSEDVS